MESFDDRVPASGPVAYFSMEIALESSIATYCGGLGVLAGDTIRAAADLGEDLVALTLVHRGGYFLQHVDREGHQSEEPRRWSVEEFLEECEPRAEIRVAGRTVLLRAWKYEVRGLTGHVVPVYLLDSDLPENDAEDRALTDSLYGGDPGYRLRQEAILGIGGVRMLRALGHDGVRRFHMNEGHASLLTLALLEEAGEGDWDSIGPSEVELVRRQCVFTTHTPVGEGQDRYPRELAEEVLGWEERTESGELEDQLYCDGALNLTHLGLNFSRYVNGVPTRSGEVSGMRYLDYPIDSICTGIHCATWASPPMQELFDRHLPQWRKWNPCLRYAATIPISEIQQAHHRAKGVLLEQLQRATGVALRSDAFTLGWARRFTEYKRPGLVFVDPAALRRIAEEEGPLQIVFAGKAHPEDAEGKALIEKVVAAGNVLAEPVRFVYLENHDLEISRLLCSGVDLWLNTPEPPFETSGTSGMKAAVNGVPSLSVLDGWWAAGFVPGVTGWAFSGEGGDSDALSLYEALRRSARCFYREPARYGEVMRNAIALNASFFNAQRMVQEYAVRAWA